MIIKTLKLTTKKENTTTLINNFININQYRRVYADEDSFIFSSLLNKIEVTLQEKKLKLLIKPKIELLFVPFVIFFLTQVYFDLLLLSVSFAVVAYAIFVYEQIVICSGIRRQLKTKKDVPME